MPHYVGWEASTTSTGFDYELSHFLPIVAVTLLLSMLVTLSMLVRILVLSVKVCWLEACCVCLHSFAGERQADPVQASTVLLS